jgi:hypothetical protein
MKYLKNIVRIMDKNNIYEVIEIKIRDEKLFSKRFMHPPN